MIRNIVAAAVALFVFVGGLCAAEYKGKLTKVDAEKNTITINIKKDKKDKVGEDKTFSVDKDAKFITVKQGWELPSLAHRLPARGPSPPSVPEGALS